MGRQACRAGNELAIGPLRGPGVFANISACIHLGYRWHRVTLSYYRPCRVCAVTGPEHLISAVAAPAHTYVHMQLFKKNSTEVSHFYQRSDWYSTVVGPLPPVVTFL